MLFLFTYWRLLSYSQISPRVAKLCSWSFHVASHGFKLFLLRVPCFLHSRFIASHGSLRCCFVSEDFHMVSMWRFHRSQSVLRHLSECVSIAPEIYSHRFPCNFWCTFVTVARWFSPRCLLVSCWFPHATLVNYLSLFADFLKCSYAFPLACLWLLFAIVTVLSRCPFVFTWFLPGFHVYSYGFANFVLMSTRFRIMGAHWEDSHLIFVVSRDSKKGPQNQKNFAEVRRTCSLFSGPWRCVSISGTMKGQEKKEERRIPNHKQSLILHNP